MRAQSDFPPVPDPPAMPAVPSPPSAATPASSLNGGVLTTAERLQASSLAQSFVLQIASCKAPLRQRVLEEIRRLLDE